MGVDPSTSKTSNCSSGALVPVIQLGGNDTFQPSLAPPASALTNATDAGKEHLARDLEKLKGLVSRGKVMMNLAKAELESMNTIVQQCELYFGAGDPDVQPGSKKKS